MSQDKPRICTVFIPLPAYATDAERIASLDADVREAAGQAEKKLREYAQKFVVTGWVADDDAEYAVTHTPTGRTLVGRLRITRGGAP